MIKVSIRSMSTLDPIPYTLNQNPKPILKSTILSFVVVMFDSPGHERLIIIQFQNRNKKMRQSNELRTSLSPRHCRFLPACSCYDMALPHVIISRLSPRYSHVAHYVSDINLLNHVSKALIVDHVHLTTHFMLNVRPIWMRSIFFM